MSTKLDTTKTAQQTPEDLQRCKTPKKHKKHRTPKRIWIRSLMKQGFVSVSEYKGIQRRNIVEPFNVHGSPSGEIPPYAYLRMRIDQYQRLNNNRPVVAVICRDDFNAKHVADCLEIPIE